MITHTCVPALTTAEGGPEDELVALQAIAAAVATLADNNLSVTVTPAAMRSQTETVRAANVTPYAAGDVVGGVINFLNMGIAGSHVMLTSVDIRLNIAALPSGMANLRLYLYSAPPPSALADNAAWDLASGDRSNFIGYIDLGTPVDLGSTLFAQVDCVNKQCKLAAAETSLYGYLVTTAGFTPAAASEVYVTTLRAVAL